MFKRKKMEDSSPIGQGNEKSSTSSTDDPPPSDTSNSDPKSNIFNPNDIGLYVDIRLQDEEKVKLVDSFWKPSFTYKFPVLEKFQKRNLKFQFSWFTAHPWLVYSEKEEGAFCKYCVLFAKHGAGVNSQELGSLVKKKFTNWVKAKEVFKNHAETDYHNACITDFKNLKRTLENRSLQVINQIDTARSEAILRNRHNLKPIIETVILCGRQELALRGHRDSGNIDTNSVCTEKNEGNFRALLRYRSQGDRELKDMLDGSGKIKYLSPLLQNEIISSCNNVIKGKLVEEINNAIYFSVLADETSDISNMEQISICIRYVSVEEGHHIVKEQFLQFVPTTEYTGKALANKILESLESYGLNLKGLRGQGYDGAAAMSGQYNGVNKFVQDKHPLAVYVHCAAHSLNLAVTRACEVQEIRNCLGTIERCYTFFNSPKRQAVLNDVIERSALDPKTKTLKRLCATRWVAKFDAVRDFLHVFDFVLESLDVISSWKDSSDAINLKWALLNTEFCVAIHVIAHVFAFGMPLCKALQKESLDLKEAVVLAEDCLSELLLMRSNAEEEFHTIFNEVKAVASDVDFELKLPRLCSKQKNRSNAPITSKECNEVINQEDQVEKHFRINLFLPFIDFFVRQLEDRFKKHKDIFEGFQCLFSFELNSETRSKLDALVQFYANDVFSNIDDIYVELKLWRKEMDRTNNHKALKSAITSLDTCDQTLYPSIYQLLKILCTLPVTTCTPERTFSTLKRIKTYLRNSTGQVSVAIVK